MTGPPDPERPPTEGPGGGAWAEAERAAAELREELAAAGHDGDFVGLRVVSNVVGRPVIQLGTVDPHVALALADLLRVATTRTLYIVQGAPEDPPRVE
jgi:hypothetical protein